MAADLRITKQTAYIAQFTPPRISVTKQTAYIVMTASPPPDPTPSRRRQIVNS